MAARAAHPHRGHSRADGRRRWHRHGAKCVAPHSTTIMTKMQQNAKVTQTRFRLFALFRSARQGRRPNRQRRAPVVVVIVNFICCHRVPDPARGSPRPLPGHSVQREPTSPHVRRENSRNKPGTSSTNNFLNALTCAAVSPRTSHHPPNCRIEQDHSVTVSASRATTHKHSTPRRRHPTATPPQAA